MQVHRCLNKPARANRAGSLFWVITCLIVYVVCGLGASAYAKQNVSVSRLIEFLAQEKIELTLALNESKLKAPPVDHDAYLKERRENEAMLALNRAKITDLENFLTYQKQQQQDYVARLKHLQQTPLSSTVQTSSQERIGKINTLTDVNKKTIELITDNLTLANRFQAMLSLRKQQLDLWQSKEQMLQQIHKLRDEESKFNDSLVRLYDDTVKLQRNVKSNNGFAESYLAEAKLLLNNQLINLTQAKIAEINLQKKIVKASYLLLKNPNIRTLQQISETYQDAITQLSGMEQSLKKMTTILTDAQSHLQNDRLKKQFSALLRIVNSKIEGLAIQEQTLQEDLENHQEELKKQLSMRQGLSEYGLDSWPMIIQQLVHIPTQFYGYLKTLIVKIKDNYSWQDVFTASMLWVTLAIIGLLAFGLQMILKRLTADKERSRLSGHLFDGVLVLFQRNLPHLTALALGWIVVYANHILFSNYQLLLNLMVVWLIFRSLIIIARLVLLERITDSSGKDVGLYHRIKWLLLIGGWTTALMVVSHLLPLSMLLQDLFNQLFMLFLLTVSWVSWRSKDLVSHLLEPVLKEKKKYLQHAVLLLTLLIPLTLFATAVTGLIGYINLAWSISRYEVQVILVITFYVLARGLLIDALELVSEWMIQSMTNGWLWIEVYLKPLDKIVRLMLLMFSVFVLCQCFGVRSDSYLVQGLIKFGQYPLINLSGIYITSISIIEFVIVLSLFIWASKWTREFAYRWLYRNTKDVGVRNSLAVFTQYAVILLGAFITLRILGLDFSGMAMVIGGLAVGMGFGLRDFASNIVGGLMLLIERPVREGDLITLGDYEGRVSHIGIRTMRVSSWDNMEVLIPNAETFNKPFTNWTHQDSIVRTVVPIKVSRVDDPIIIQQLIFDVLAIIPEILSEPAPQVFLKQIDDALIEFEIRYFINVQLYSRFEIRSKVLFAIIAQFKAAGVNPPIPPLSIELKDNHHASIPSNAFEK